MVGCARLRRHCLHRAANDRSALRRPRGARFFQSLLDNPTHPTPRSALRRQTTSRATSRLAGARFFTLAGSMAQPTRTMAHPRRNHPKCPRQTRQTRSKLSSVPIRTSTTDATRTWAGFRNFRSPLQTSLGQRRHHVRRDPEQARTSKKTTFRDHAGGSKVKAPAMAVGHPDKTVTVYLG